jgi:hypothetical protein
VADGIFEPCCVRRLTALNPRVRAPGCQPAPAARQVALRPSRADGRRASRVHVIGELGLAGRSLRRPARSLQPLMNCHGLQLLELQLEPGIRAADSQRSRSREWRLRAEPCWSRLLHCTSGRSARPESLSVG